MLKDSSGSKFKNEDAGNVRDFSVQLPARAADLVEQIVLRKGQNKWVHLARKVFIETV
jgi:hypothetical protein